MTGVSANQSHELPQIICTSWLFRALSMCLNLTNLTVYPTHITLIMGSHLKGNICGLSLHLLVYFCTCDHKQWNCTSRTKRADASSTRSCVSAHHHQHTHNVNDELLHVHASKISTHDAGLTFFSRCWYWWWIWWFLTVPFLPGFTPFAAWQSSFLSPALSVMLIWDETHAIKRVKTKSDGNESVIGVPGWRASPLPWNPQERNVKFQPPHTGSHRLWKAAPTNENADELGWTWLSGNPTLKREWSCREPLNSSNLRAFYLFLSRWL